MINKSLLICMMIGLLSGCLPASQAPIDTTGRDVIILSRDRGVSFNGKRFEIYGAKAGLTALTQIFDKQPRVMERRLGYSLIWDHNGVAITIENNIIVHVSINFADHKRFREEYFSPQFGFDGVLKIEDGYIDKETAIEVFRRSTVGEAFGKRTGLFGESYSPKAMFIKTPRPIWVVIHSNAPTITQVSIY